MAETELPELWSFNDSDLAFNRFGKLTEKQNFFLAGEHKMQSGVFLGIWSPCLSHARQ